MDGARGNGSVESVRLKYLLGAPHEGQDLDPDSLVPFAPMEAIGETGQLDLSEKRPVEAVVSGYTKFHGGDVLVAKITPCFENGKGAVVPELEGGIAFGTTELHVLTPGPGIDGRYLYYVTMSDVFRRLGEAEMTGAAGQKRVPEDFVKNFRLTTPQLEEQRLIAAYLDRETASIDRLISEKESLLKLLEQKHAAIVTQVLLEGLDARVPMKASGQQWLGDVPAHWGLRRAKWLFRERDERSVGGDEELLTVSHITGVSPRSEKEVNMFLAEDMAGYKMCYPGDLVVNTLWAWMGAMGVSSRFGIVSPSYHIYTPAKQLSSDYIDPLCRSKPFVAEVTRHSRGVWSSRLRLYPEEFFGIIFPVPPAPEQAAMVASVSEERRRSQVLGDSVSRSIGLLKARRQALISDAVTGRIPGASFNS